MICDRKYDLAIKHFADLFTDIAHKETIERPIVFIASCFGGLLLEEVIDIQFLQLTKSIG
jgi:hypothetical protein